MIRDHCYPKCGDGVRVPRESCDDGNTQDPDHIVAAALVVNGFPLFSCNSALQDGDGCSSRCQIEMGYACHGGNTTHVDTCGLTVCGDGVVEADFIDFPRIQLKMQSLQSLHALLRPEAARLCLKYP